MVSRIVHTNDMVTLLGGGEVRLQDLAMARRHAPILVAADGGADRALEAGWPPDAVIGDFDSVSPEAQAAIASEKQHRITEQESTDFDKCLRSIQAPLILGLGFLGARLDHQLAAMSTLAAHPTLSCVLLGETDVVFHCPPRLRLDLEAGQRVSLYPIGSVQGSSRGLKWPIDGLAFSPSGRIGTSNEAQGPIEIQMSSPGMLVILPRVCLPEVIRSLTAGG